MNLDAGSHSVLAAIRNNKSFDDPVSDFKLSYEEVLQKLRSLLEGGLIARTPSGVEVTFYGEAQLTMGTVPPRAPRLADDELAQAWVDPIPLNVVRLPKGNVG